MTMVDYENNMLAIYLFLYFFYLSIYLFIYLFRISD